MNTHPNLMLTNEALFDALMAVIYGEVKRRADAVTLPACDYAEIPPAHVAADAMRKVS